MRGKAAVRGSRCEEADGSVLSHADGLPVFRTLATDTGYSVADRALEPHGGYGYLGESGMENIVRGLRVHRILEGTNELMRVIVSRGPTEASG